MNRAYSAEMIDAFDLDATFSTDAQAGIPGDVITTLTIPNPAHPELADQPAVDAYFGSIQLLEGSQITTTDATVITRIPLLTIFDENGLRQWTTRLGSVVASRLASDSYAQGDRGFFAFGLFFPQTIPEQFYMRQGWSLVMLLFQGQPGDRYFPRFTFKR